MHRTVQALTHTLINSLAHALRDLLRKIPAAARKSQPTQRNGKDEENNTPPKTFTGSLKVKTQTHRGPQFTRPYAPKPFEEYPL